MLARFKSVFASLSLPTAAQVAGRETQDAGHVVGTGVVVVIACFVLLVHWYGEAWLVPWHDEVVIGRLAQNLGNGAGFRNDWMDGLLPGADRRTYWQMPAYPIALAGWGKLWGFDLNTMRELSRCLSVIALLLLFALGRCVGLAPLWRLVVVLWTASDLNFQFAANFVRPEALCTTLLIAASVAAAKATVTDDPLPWWLSVGICTASAVLTHPLALLPSLVLFVTAWRQTGWRGASAAGVPMLVAMGGWLLYAAQEPALFLAQMRAHWAHKQKSGVESLLLLATGADFWGIWRYLGVPMTPQPAAAIALIGAYYAWSRRRCCTAGWLGAFVVALYTVVALGAEAWYPAVFVPFGYLLAAWLCHDLAVWRPTWRPMLLTVAAVWWSLQAALIVRHATAVPRVRTEVQAFTETVAQLLPHRAVVLIGSFSPDPTYALRRVRPDVRVYALMPLRMVNRSALHRLQGQLTHALVLEPRLQGVTASGVVVRRWHFTFGGLSAPRRGVRVVLLRCAALPTASQGAHNSKRLAGF
ncbi:hypothetical protein HRbin17_00564 [bacterium HR17]|uniref:Glycosyltransferase RgtA/B/C/D-like domain-containing protein n=1 Tax=Candidatus Fervidibacter japonicus TaxID=2035412 RepID=A0A2H5XA60_9BACT|nr:hypothetical protein HRbin17_00564 [bacterium HR17]